MIIECIGNAPKHLLSERARKAYERNIHLEEVNLEIGKQYIVYGVGFSDGEDLPWFLICEEDDEYPKPHLGEFFKLVDGEIPAGWVFTTTASNIGNSAILPKKWANDPSFLEKLDDEEADALEYFRWLKTSV